MLGENHGFIGDKQGEHSKEVKRDHEVVPHPVDGSLLQSLLGFTHGVFSLEQVSRIVFIIGRQVQPFSKIAVRNVRKRTATSCVWEWDFPPANGRNAWL